MTIRRLAPDFDVIETLAPAAAASVRPRPAPGCLHALYALTKASLTTPEACERIARALRMHTGDIAYAGLKDKHAHTRQHVTVRARDVRHAEALVRTIDGPGWSAARIGWTSHPINAEWIDRNRFEIVVRALTADAARRMDARAALLRDPLDEHRWLIVNYFGAQRFGSARHGQGFAARRLIDGDFEGALRLLIGTPARKDAGDRRAFTRALAERWGEWGILAPTLPALPEREAVRVLARGGTWTEAFGALPEFLKQMCTDAYQSHLWNRAAASTVGSLPGTSTWTADDGFGTLHFVPAHALAVSLRAARLPMPAPRVDGPLAQHTLMAMADEGLVPERMVIPGVRRPLFEAFDRPLVMTAERVAIDGPEADELAAAGSTASLKRAVRFSLPSGSYATVVLRALGE